MNIVHINDLLETGVTHHPEIKKKVMKQNPYEEDTAWIYFGIETT